MLYRFYHQFPSPLLASPLAKETFSAEITKPVLLCTKPDQFALEVFGDMHQGLMRENNEDNFHYDVAHGVFIVCDGMGGHAAGENASALAVDELQSQLKQVRPAEDAIPTLLKEAFTAANKRILQAAATNAAWQGMGSTGVVALVQEKQLHIANVGDSRAYLWRAGQLIQITQDHSVAAELELSSDELRAHPLRNRLTMALGSEHDLNPFYTALELQNDDVFLLCSDGLWDMLSDAEIAELLAVSLSPQEAVNLLIQAANAAGGDDNITAVLVSLAASF